MPPRGSTDAIKENNTFLIYEISFTLFLSVSIFMLVKLASSLFFSISRSNAIHRDIDEILYGKERPRQNGWYCYICSHPTVSLLFLFLLLLLFIYSDDQCHKRY